VDLPASAGHLKLLAHAGKAEVVESQVVADGVSRVVLEKPVPSSPTWRRTCFWLIWSITQARCALACLVTLVRASWATRYSTVS